MRYERVGLGLFAAIAVLVVVLAQISMTSEGELSLAQTVERLRARYADAVYTIELLEGYRQQVTADAAALENPRAVLEYLDFFSDLVCRVSDECARIGEALSRAPDQSQADALRHLATLCAGEQQRCLQFRDKWINRPLPHERMRPLLNDLSVTTRDQLTAFQDLQTIAGFVDQLTKPQPPDEERGLGRRELFTKLFRR
jgi:hypothetical protein